MTAQTRTSPRFGLLIFFLGICLAAAVVTLNKAGPAADASAPESATTPDEGMLDLTRPVPRQQVLALFRQLFALPAEDYLDWEESVAAGKIPPDVQAFHEHIVAYNEEVKLGPEELSTEGMPFIDLEDGPRVYPILKASLGPEIGANVSQTDLNSLLPELADIQKRVWERGEQREAEAAEEPEFVQVALKPEDLAIARTHESATPETVEMEIPGGDDPGILHVELPAPLDGRHVKGARISTDPFVSVHIELTELGSEILSDVTAEGEGGMFAILLGGEFHSVVAVGGQIRSRKLQLPGSFTEEKAQQLLDAWSGSAIQTASD